MADKEEILAFVSRPWGKLEALGRRFRAERFRQDPAAPMAASQLLWQHMKSVRPDWPDARQRQQDLEHHIHLKRQLDDAARALRSR